DVTGQYDQALQFDGVDDHVSIPNSALINQLENDLTVMAWIRPDGLSGLRRIAASARANGADGFGFGTNDTGLRFQSFDVQQYDTTTVTLSSGVWQHVAAVMHADNSVTFYVNGVPKETVSGSTPINPDVDDDFLIGMTTVSGSATPTQHFGGLIDEVHVFTRALTSGEIGGLAQQRVGGVAQLDIAFAPIDPESPFYNESLPASTVLYMPFDESGGNPDGSETTQFADISGSRLQATCDGASCPATGAVGRAGQALRFDGQDDFLAIPDDPALNLDTDFTLSAWFKWDAERISWWSWPHDYVIYDSGTQAGHWYVSINDHGFLAFTESGVMHNPADWIRDTSIWHHAAVVKDGDGTDNLTVYLDGEPVITRSVGTVTTPSGEKRIGSTAEGTGAFEGLLDKVALYDQPFSADEIHALYLSSRPLLHLPFDQTWAAGGSVLLDQSSWDNDATLNGPATQHIVAGNVGAGALQLNGVDDYVTVENSVDLAQEDYTLAAWFKTGASVRGAILAATNPADGNRGLLLEARANGALRYLHRAPSGTSGGAVIWPSATYNDGEWHHAVAVKEGSHLTLYADGVVIGQANDSNNFTHALDVTLGRIGRETDSDYFDGALDDVRIYARALPVLEVQALYDSRWRAVSLPESGADVVRTGWTYTIPSGLEGSYRVDLRGWDTVGNHSRGDSNSRDLWRGALDTLPPRVELRQRNWEYGSTSYVRYDFGAQDFNLSEDDLQDPCADKARHLEREYMSAPWYAALVGQSTQDSTRLYELDGKCRFAGVGRLSSHTVMTSARDIYVSGDYAYMIGYAITGTMWVVDVSNPKHPTRVGTNTPIPHGSSGIHVSGDYAYVIEDETGTMGVVDISNPSDPQEVGFTSSPGNQSKGIYVIGSTAYVANTNAGLRVINVSIPASPTEIGFYDTPGYAVDIHVVGNTAYVADGDGGLRVVDVSTPTLPQETGHLTMTWAEGVYVTGTYA
ncbi:MAG: hypothetical protein GY851_20880, partial [bacterium]|nr:hypothetical protein [bacterium]